MKGIWNIKNWDYFKSYDLGFQLFNETIYCPLYKKKKLFLWSGKTIENIKLNIEDYGPDQLIIYYNNQLYLIPNKDFKLNFNSYLEYIDIEINMVKDTVKNNKIEKFVNLLKPLKEYKYKSKFYTFFLIQWLKLNIKIKIYKLK